MKRILINATQPEELRIALVDGQKLQDLDVEPRSGLHKKDNIYKGVVTRIEPSLEAVFIEYGDEKHGFLPFKNILPECLGENYSPDRPLKSAIQKNQPFLVQVLRDERGNKGALFTTKISLAGHYIVLMPNSSKSGGVSRRASSTERTDARRILEQLDCKDNESVILRSGGVKRDIEDIKGELDSLRALWDKIRKAEKEAITPRLLYQESGIMIRTLRDHFHEDIDEYIIDDEQTHEEALSFIRFVKPEDADKIKLYQEPVPLFNRHQIENQINQAYERKVSLPSGGVLVFDPTEAMLSIDINSAKHTRRSDIEETALSVNLEACDEIARQLKLRDIGGLIVIDFIDMGPSQNKQKVEQRLEQCLARDRARTRTGRISMFGILEMSRQRLHASLAESSHNMCPHCDGHGVVRTTQSAALAVLRMLEDNAVKESTISVYARLPADILEFLLNEKRAEITDIEDRHKVHIVFVNDRLLQTPHFKVICQRAHEPKPVKQITPQEHESETGSKEQQSRTDPRQQPMVGQHTYPSSVAVPSASLLRTALTSVISLIKGPPKKSEATPEVVSGPGDETRKRSRRSGRRGRGQSPDNKNARQSRNGENRRTPAQKGQERSRTRTRRGTQGTAPESRPSANSRRSTPDVPEKSRARPAPKERSSAPEATPAAKSPPAPGAVLETPGNARRPRRAEQAEQAPSDVRQDVPEEKIKPAPIEDVLDSEPLGGSRLVQVQTKKASGDSD